MAKDTFDRDLLALYLERKMEERGLSLRPAAEQVGCSPATLGRLLQGSESENIPDTVNVIRAASWLGMSLSDFERGSKKRESTLADVQVHLRGLRGISDETADSIFAMVRAAYDSAAAKEKRRKPGR